MEKVQFYLRSIETFCNDPYYQQEIKRQLCTVEKIIDEKRGLILVSVDPIIPRNTGNSLDDFNVFVLANKHYGYTLLPQPHPLPCYVYVLAPKEGCRWDTGPYAIIDWGLIEEIVSDEAASKEKIVE